LAEETIIRFAGYELDPASRSLRQNGREVSLGPKTFDLLVYLASHAHQVVTKEELLTAVWPDSFVEEGNLSQHVFLLRKALGGAGQGDRLIITVTGKGYQFAAPVDLAPRRAAPQQAGELVLHAVQSVTRVIVEEHTEDDAPPQLALPAPRKRIGRWVWFAAPGAIVLLAAASFFAWRWLHPAPAGHIDLVMSVLENTTGDPDFDHILNQAFQIDLEQSPYLNLLSRSKIQETLTEMQRKKDEPLAPALALEVCERDNAQAMLHGSISKFGSKYLLILDAASCVTGQQIAGYRAEASTKDDVLAALDTAAERVRRQLGESAASLERFQIPISQATTPSLDALRAYSLAQEGINNGDMKGAQSLGERAIALDPNFAMAYRLIGVSYYNRSDYAQATAFMSKAFALREHATERERLLIEIAYYAIGIYDYEATVRSMKLFNQIYPNFATNWGNLCNMYTQLAEYPEAIEAGEHASRMDPHSGFVAQVLARAYKRANRFADAKRVGQDAQAAGIGWGVHSILFQIAYAEHDAAAMKTEHEWRTAHQDGYQSLDDLGFAAATSGKLREAKDDFSRARADALRDGNTAYAEAVLLDLAGVQIDLNETAQAAATMKQLKADGGNPGGFAADKAQTGDLAPAQRFASAVGAGDDRNTVHIFCELPFIRGLLAIKAHKPEEAVHLLEPARPYQLRDFAVPYLRAQAETEAGLLDAAADDYRLILANQGVDPISPEYSLSHLQLARVLALQKKTDQARIEYKAFLEAWKDADPDLKLLQDAKRELAKLQ
jgi:DNA-binding winged helix-turn-helix (wHTH) protein/tetratricopeptide (TPR) repeat protein